MLEDSIAPVLWEILKIWQNLKKLITQPHNNESEVTIITGSDITERLYLLKK